jgi:hypothetical protein
MYHILGASHGGTGPATSHISSPYIKIVSAVKIYSRGGVSISVCKYLYFSKTDISHNCKEKDLEICAIKLDTKSFKLIILSLHEQLPTLINFFITINEKLSFQQTEKGDPISVL